VQHAGHDGVGQVGGRQEASPRAPAMGSRPRTPWPAAATLHQSERLAVQACLRVRLLPPVAEHPDVRLARHLAGRRLVPREGGDPGRDRGV